ncbi:MAG: type II toxin-antitoxin system HicB family antitoxin [Treponema sp.]|jgi:antitoxin HicB|nr:type II toxin-antitoxin system HicB family antitoxin [Treponema sp.]
MIYYCTIVKDDDIFIAQFPDMTNIVTGGFSREEALAMAKEALDGCLESDVAHGRDIPAPSFQKGYPVSVANHIVIALQLRKLRGSQSQTDIAKRLGISYQAYQRLENPRKSNPTIKTLERIVNICGGELDIQIH